MKVNQKTPNNIELTIKNIKDDLSVCTLKHKKTKLSTWFLFDGDNYETILKKGIASISIGYTRKLILHGVGFKADLIEDKVDGNNLKILSLRIGKKLPCNSIIPENVYMYIEGNIVHAWAPNISIIDNMFFKILKNKAIKKGTITSSN